MRRLPRLPTSVIHGTNAGVILVALPLWKHALRRLRNMENRSVSALGSTSG
jgi:hypothetical protein